MSTAGRKALIKVSGTAVAMTNEATTADAGRIEYTITNAAKSVWDRTVGILVETSPDGSSWSTATGYVIDRLSGKVIFGSARAVGTQIRVSGSYLPMSTAAEAKSYTYELSAVNADAGIFGDTWMKRTQMTKSASGQLGQWRTTDTYMETQLLAGNAVLLEFFSNASLASDIRIWAFLSPQEVQAVVDGLVEQTVSFESTTDNDGRSVSGGAVSAGGGSIPAGNEQLVSDLGGNTPVLAFYDARNNVTASGGFVDQWDDTRGASGFGPPLTSSGSNRPAYDGTTINSDNTDDRMTTAASALFDLSVAKSIIYIGELNAGDAGVNEYAVSICESTSVVRLLAIRDDVSGTVSGIAGLASAYQVINTTGTASTNRRLILVGKNATTGLRARMANLADQTQVAASSEGAGNNQLTIFDAFPGVGQYAAAKCRAIIVLNRDYTSGDYTTLKAYANAQHSTIDA